MSKYKLVRGTFRSSPGELLPVGSEVELDDAWVKHIGPGVFEKVGAETPKHKPEPAKVEKGGR